MLNSQAGYRLVRMSSQVQAEGRVSRLRVSAVRANLNKVKSNINFKRTVGGGVGGGEGGGVGGGVGCGVGGGVGWRTKLCVCRKR